MNEKLISLYIKNTEIKKCKLFLNNVPFKFLSYESYVVICYWENK